MNKEIEEISDIISDHTEFCDVGGGSVSIDENEVAKAIYYAGYRKQEICVNLSCAFDNFKCSKCGHCCDDVCSLEEDDDGEVFHYDFQFKFCPNCGAKVKD